MKLYDISEETVSSIIKDRYRNVDYADGKYELIGKESFTQYGYPIKVVFSQEKGRITVITAYPLKREFKK